MRFLFRMGGGKECGYIVVSHVVRDTDDRAGSYIAVPERERQPGSINCYCFPSWFNQTEKKVLNRDHGCSNNIRRWQAVAVPDHDGLHETRPHRRSAVRLPSEQARSTRVRADGEIRRGQIRNRKLSSLPDLPAPELPRPSPPSSRKT